MKRAVAAVMFVALIACGRENAPPSSGSTVAEARGIVDDVTHARWDHARDNFAPLMAQSLSSQQLAAAWASFVKLKGAYRSQGNADVVERPRFTVVDVVLHMTTSDGVARITFDKRGQIAGLFFLQPGVPVP